MNHRFKLHPDGTLEITMPKGKKVGRVLVCEAGTQNGSLYYPETDGMEVDEFCRTMDMAIKATNLDDEYSFGMRNGFRYAKAVVTGEEPECEEIKPKKWIKRDVGVSEPVAICPSCGFGVLWHDRKCLNCCPICGERLEV